MKISSIEESSRAVVVGTGHTPSEKEVIDSLKSLLKIDGATSTEVLQRAIDMLANRPQTRTSRSVLSHLFSIVQRLKISVGADHYKKLNWAVDRAVESQQPTLQEINMSPSALADFAKSADKYGVQAGFEVEMLFTDIKPNGDSGESEPDYDGTDERIYPSATLSDLQDFFSETISRNNRVWARMEEAYLDGVYEKAQEFVDENIDERVRERVLDEVSEDDRLYNYLSSNGHSDEEIEEIIAAGNDAPQFSKAAELRAYTEANPLYKAWTEAQDAVEEELESEMDRMREEVEEELRDEYMSNNEYYLGEWLNDNNIDYMSELSNEYELDWPHWTENTEYEAFDEYEMQSAADELEEAIGMDVRVSSGYHNASRRDDSYIIEPDGSLEPDDPSEHASAEIVSPPMPLDQAIDHLKKVIDWAKNHGGYTNSSTGLHVGVSVPDMSKVDYVKLALLVGDEYVLKIFDREMNSFCKSVFKKIATNRNEQTVAQAVDALKSGMIEVASTALKYTVFKSSGTTDKYVSANWKNRYIEFRSMGGDYVDDVDKIVNTIYRYVRAIVSSADPEMDRKEYLTKLYKIVQKANEDIRAPEAVEPVNMILTKYLAGEVGKETIQQYKTYFRQVAAARKDPNAQKPSHPAGEISRWRVSGNGIEIVVRARNEEDARARARQQNSSLDRLRDNEIYVRQLEGPPPAPEKPHNWAIMRNGEDRAIVSYYSATEQEAQREFHSWANSRIGNANQYRLVYIGPGNRPAASQGEFRGWWKIVDSSGRELYRFNGVGNSQSDANRVARQWLERNQNPLSRGQQGEQYDVLPVLE